jgi:hypothetical protein
LTRIRGYQAWRPLGERVFWVQPGQRVAAPNGSAWRRNRGHTRARPCLAQLVVRREGSTPGDASAAGVVPS